MSSFEQGPIRPPSEAESLIVRIIRNCPWDKCLFCYIYHEEFSWRTIEEIKDDIRAMKEAKERVLSYALRLGKDSVTEEVVQQVYDQEPDLLQIALWLYRGGKNVFLQDGDGMVMPPQQLAMILRFIKEQFPSVERITTYGRSKTISGYTADQLKMLKDAGLTRIHTGLDTGNDPLLKFLNKGVTAQEQIEAGLLVKEAGISLSEHIHLGLGGRRYWREHALDTAIVLSAIDPPIVRMRTFVPRKGSQLMSYIENGDFQVQNDDGLALEERLLLQNFDGTGQLVSDHILNLLEEVEGRLPDDMEKAIGVVNNYINLPPDERIHFSLGRRLGFYRYLRDTTNPILYYQVEEIKTGLKNRGKDVDEFITECMSNYI